VTSIGPFSQLIRDTVEEALSLVKGANSVKIFGSSLGVVERVALLECSHAVALFPAAIPLDSPFGEVVVSRPVWCRAAG
jgi:hypothetical protein